MNIAYLSELTAKLLGWLVGLVLIALPIWALLDMRKKQQSQKEQKISNKSPEGVNNKKTARKLLLKILPTAIVVLAIILIIIFCV